MCLNVEHVLGEINHRVDVRYGGGGEADARLR